VHFSLLFFNVNVCLAHRGQLLWSQLHGEPLVVRNVLVHLHHDLLLFLLRIWSDVGVPRKSLQARRSNDVIEISSELVLG